MMVLQWRHRNLKVNVFNKSQIVRKLEDQPNQNDIPLEERHLALFACHIY